MARRRRPRGCDRGRRPHGSSPTGGFAVRGEERGVGNAGSDGARERGGERARELGHLGVHRRELLAPVRGDLLAVHQPIHKLGVVDVDGKLSLGAVVALGLARHHHRGRAREERRNDRRDAAGRAKGCAGGRFQRPEIGFDRPTNDEAGPVEKSRARCRRATAARRLILRDEQRFGLARPPPTTTPHRA